VENDHPFLVIRRPTAYRANIVTLPNALAFLRVIVDFQVAKFPGKLQVF
jgi:hypothetical protein